MVHRSLKLTAKFAPENEWLETVRMRFVSFWEPFWPTFSELFVFRRVSLCLFIYNCLYFTRRWLMETWTSPVQFLQEGPSSSNVTYKLHKTVVPKATCSAMEDESHTYSGWWVQAFFILTPTWGSDPMWLILIFFKWAEHQQIFLEIHPLYKQILVKSDKFKVLYI